MPSLRGSQGQSKLERTKSLSLSLLLNKSVKLLHDCGVMNFRASLKSWTRSDEMVMYLRPRSVFFPPLF